MRSNPQQGNIPPTLPALVRWLRSRRVSESTMSLEKHYRQIREILYSFGTISINEVIPVKGQTILDLRVLIGLFKYLE